ncbi:GNAT family N-acetyltransferase [Stackebrandtia soli]|uniref:GNAT family N-acetyltransferase n=1 Tax=Stackebrandtia soli TaxID=1892856 RepID=UPI0039E815EF
MPSTSALPVGYSLRTGDPAEIDAIRELVNSCERQLLGRAESNRESMAAVFARPGFDPALDTVLVQDGTGTLVAHAWVDRRSEARVHPGHRGRGLGEWLLSWIEARAMEKDTRELAQVVENADKVAGELLTARGFAPSVTAWQLSIELNDEPTELPAPTGVEVRPFRSADGPAAHTLIEDAFTWQGRRKSYQEWAVLTVERGSFAPDASMMAVVDGRSVGVLLAMDDPDSADGYIEQVAVAEDHRGRGIAGSLLRYAFAAFHRRGRRGCVLWTHSATGALPLYERAGMVVRRSSTVYKKRLDVTPRNPSGRV